MGAVKKMSNMSATGGGLFLKGLVFFEDKKIYLYTWEFCAYIRYGLGEGAKGLASFYGFPNNPRKNVTKGTIKNTFIFLSDIRSL